MGNEGGPEERHATLDLAPAGRGWGLVRRKGNIPPVALTVLSMAACLPLLLAFCRILAMPGADSLSVIGLGTLRELGETLNQTFTLDWVPPSDRPKILYLMLLPTGALMVAFARMTLGVRVLGLRAILLAIGFRAAGLVPSLTLMAVVVGTIVLIRPWIRRIRLPLYARIAVVLGLSTTIMVGALLIAPWLRSEAIWSVAFFPVIIIAMLAEGIAKTLEQDNLVTAIWRAGWTIGLALVIALIGRGVSHLTYAFPELILTQVIAVVFVAEFLDLRLLEEWPARLSRLVEGARPWYTPKPKVAVVRNRRSNGVVGRLGPLAPEKYGKRSVQKPVDVLREQGFQVKVFEGDMSLLRELAGFLPSDPRRGSPGGIVLNLATGVQGEGRFSHVPAMLEMAGIPYTGPGPVAHALLADRNSLLSRLEQVRVPVPRHGLVSDPAETVDLEFPLVARPRFEPDAPRVAVRNRKRLRAAVREIRRVHRQPTVVEEATRGRSISVSLLGNETVECLPLVERSGADRTKICPAPLDDALAERIRKDARRAYAAAGCRDYARIDVRVSRFGEPVVVDIRCVHLFARRGAFVIAAEAAGYTFSTLLRRIVDEAAKRYLAAATAQAEITEPEDESRVVSLADRRAAAK
jgi:D-alanine-D-alanine ligase